MKKYLQAISLLTLLLAPSAAFAADGYTLEPQPGQIYVGEEGKWTKWNILAPGQSVQIKLDEPSNLRLQLRRTIGAAERSAQNAEVRFGPKLIRVSADKSGAVIHKSKDSLGQVRTVAQPSSDQLEWTLSGASAPIAYLVEAQPAAPQEQPKTVAQTPVSQEEKTEEAKPAAKKVVVKAESATTAKGGRFFVEPRPGFFLGKGTFSGFRGELAAGYYPGWFDDAFAFVFHGGYYGTTAEQELQDETIGTITRNWDLTSIPVGLIARLHFLTGKYRPYIAGGFDYTRVSFEYTASIPAGSLQQPLTTGLNSFLGPRGAGGFTAEVGPGEINAEVALTYAYLPQDAHGNAAEIMAPVLFAGYAYTF